jgi:LysR family transcriptional regulator, glycine cleavage system transcriptional activator
MVANWMPSLNALRAFEAVARHGSFCKAANELAVTAPAVQQMVRNLEKSLDQVLIDRQGQKITPTELGKHALPHLQKGFAQLAAGVKTIRSASDEMKLMVTVDPGFASAWLIKRLGKFFKENPEIDVTFDVSGRFSKTDHGLADISIQCCESFETGDMLSNFLFPERTIVVCSRKLLPPDLIRLDIGDLHSYTLLHTESTDILHPHPNWENWFDAAGYDIPLMQHRIKFTDYHSTLQAALMGQGLALASEPMVKDHLEAGQLVSPFSFKLSGERGHYLTYRADAVQKRSVRDFVSFVVGEAAVSAIQ